MAGTSESWCLPDRCDEAAAVSRMTSIDVQYEFGFFLHVEHLQRDALKKVETPAQRTVVRTSVRGNAIIPSGRYRSFYCCG